MRLFEEDFMKTTVLQQCNCCGKHFRLEYMSNGTYSYLDNTCDCESDFTPIDGPSINEWLEQFVLKEGTIDEA